jgi:hypothetical protein
MADSSINFDSFGDLDYSGLSDTGSGFTGSSTLQDVQLGSPLLLDSSYGPNDASSVTDAMNVPLISSTNVPNQIEAQQLAGTSDTPFGSMAQSTPTPNSAPPNNNTWAGLTALSKLGAGMASMFSQPTVTHSGAVPASATPAGAPLLGGGTSTTNTVILLVVVAALILLLARGE